MKRPSWFPEGHCLYFTEPKCWPPGKLGWTGLLEVTGDSDGIQLGHSCLPLALIIPLSPPRTPEKSLHNEQFQQQTRHHFHLKVPNGSQWPIPNGKISGRVGIIENTAHSKELWGFLLPPKPKCDHQLAPKLEKNAPQHERGGRWRDREKAHSVKARHRREQIHTSLVFKLWCARELPWESVKNTDVRETV